MIVMEVDGERVPAAALYRRLLEQGFLVGYNPAVNVLRFYPALTIDDDDIARLLENMEGILELFG